MLSSFSILTMDAAAGIKAIHARMPVMIPPNRIMDWLSPDTPFDEAVQSIIADLEFSIA